MANQLPIGVRAHNPLNLRPGSPWEGLVGVVSSSVSGDFCEFQSNVFGFRAAARTLITYFDNYGLNTVEKIISRWAPSNENDTRNYIEAVCKRTNWKSDEIINPKSYDGAWRLLRAMTIQEQGSFDKYFKKWELDDGLRRAGISDVPATPLKKNMAAITGAATSALAMSTAVQPIVDKVQQNKGLLTSLVTFFMSHRMTGLAILAGLIIVAIEVVRQNRNT